MNYVCMPNSANAAPLVENHYPGCYCAAKTKQHNNTFATAALVLLSEIRSQF